jgi:hypothetical protein
MVKEHLEVGKRAEGGARIHVYLLEKKYIDQKKLPRAPNKSWKDPEEVRNFLIFAAEKLHVNDLDDWYRVGVGQITKLGGVFSFSRIF